MTVIRIYDITIQLNYDPKIKNYEILSLKYDINRQLSQKNRNYENRFMKKKIIKYF